MLGKGLEKAFAGINFIPGVSAKMRDGIRLTADIYRPESEGPFPVLLMRIPYGREVASAPTLAHPVSFARKGYIVVIQDVRGRGDSEGDFDPFRQEVNDGYDTVMWASKLEKANGMVGMYGFSYMGYTQLLAASAQPPPLKAIAPMMTAFDWYSGWFYRDGILQASTTLYWISQMLRDEAKRVKLHTFKDFDQCWMNFGKLCYAMPLVRADPITRSEIPSYGREWLEHSAYDDYWKEFDLLSRAHELQLPMFHVAGWYDFFLRGGFDGYQTMTESGSGQRENQFMVAGPWAHMPWGDRLGGHDFGPDSKLDISDLLVQWFDYWLKDVEPKESLSGTKYFVMGTNQWRASSTWPPPDAQMADYYFNSQGNANSRFGDGKLSAKPTEGVENHFVYEPDYPALAPGGNHGGETFPGPFDQAEAQQFNNTLVYTSEPVKKDLTIAGRPTCSLFVRSSAPETDFVVKITRVTKDGEALFLTLGAIRLSQGKIDENGVAQLDIEMDDTACQFRPEERIRVDVASSAFPLMIRNPNTGLSPERVSSAAEFQRAMQVVYNDRKYPSRLTLPIISSLEEDT